MPESAEAIVGKMIGQPEAGSELLPTSKQTQAAASLTKRMVDVNQRDAGVHLARYQRAATLSGKRFASVVDDAFKATAKGMWK